MKKIKDLIDCDFDIDIYGINDDSRYIKKGYLFVATKGFNVDHYDYIDDAIKNGASFIIADRDIKIDFPHIIVDKNISDLYRLLCKKFYDVDFNKLRITAVTGTDGKTTTATIIKNIIKDCAYIGTNGLEIFNESYHTSNTTPIESELYGDIKRIIDANCENLSMEVSSEALLHNRVKDFRFDVVGITNVTGDHLNIHKTFENYVFCKKKILDLVKDNGFAVLNGDDKILSEISGKNIIKFGFNSDNDYIIDDVKYFDKYTEIYLKHDKENIKIVSPYKARYNAINVSMAFIMCRLYGIADDIILSRIKELKPIKGRTESLDFGQDYDIILDYAHTINGIKNIITAFRDYDNVITVTGSAGGREHEKRRVIGKYVIENSDVAIFTMDDPRYEDVNDIIDQMAGDSKDYIRIPDREEAIKYALDIADAGSVVLILGKGRDEYMAIEDKKPYYCDYDVIERYFKEK